MPEMFFEYGGIGILAFLALGSLILLHYLLFREYAFQEKLHQKRLAEMEELVKNEIQKSRSLSQVEFETDQIREKTNEKLEVIKLQVEGMKARESARKSD